VIGDTVGDPFKDTTSVSLNPIIKFSTLFGLLAVEIAVHIKQAAMPPHNGFDFTPYVGVALLAVGLYFVWRSFYAMRIPREDATAHEQLHMQPTGATAGEPVEQG
jgi:K(+)-stimulated pyrophosphate-energized sodium pump